MRITRSRQCYRGFSALQRAEIAEIRMTSRTSTRSAGSFSALQRAEIAEMRMNRPKRTDDTEVSVLFNEPKLLKCDTKRTLIRQRIPFQCSSTSRNC